MRRFTPVEAMTVLLLLVGLSGLTTVGLLRARASARRQQCRANLRRVGQAMKDFHGIHNAFPPGFGWETSPYRYLSWTVWIYPYLGEQERWERATYDYLEHGRSFDAHAGFSMPLPLFSCPSDARTRAAHLVDGQMLVALTDYLGVLGTDYRAKDGTLFVDSRISQADIDRGTSYTLLVGERPPPADLATGWLYAGIGQENSGSIDVILGANEINSHTVPEVSECRQNRLTFRPATPDAPCASLHFWSMHPDGAMFLYVDGHVEFKSYGGAEILIRAARRSVR